MRKKDHLCECHVYIASIILILSMTGIAFIEADIHNGNEPYSHMDLDVSGTINDTSSSEHDGPFSTVSDENDYTRSGSGSHPWPMLCGDLRHTGLSRYDTSDNPGKIKLQIAHLGSLHQPLIGEDGSIFISISFSGEVKFRAMYPNGTEKWSIPFHTDYIPALSPDGTIYITTEYRLMAVDSSNGTVEWLREIERYPSSVSLGEDGIIYFTTQGSDQQFHLNAYYPNGTQKWNISLEGESVRGGPCLFYPAIDESNNIYTTIGNIAYSIYPNGTIRWRSQLGIFSFLTSPTLGVDGTIYIQDINDLVALYGENGTLKWNRTIEWEEPSKTIPAIGPDGNIYCGSIHIYAFTPDGDLLWKHYIGGRITTPTIGAEGTVYFSYSDTFYAFYPNGTVKWKTKLDWSIQDDSGVINSDGDIYVCGKYFSILGKVRPTPPSNCLCSSGDSFVNLSWEYPDDDGGAAVTNYNIYRGNTSAGKEHLITLGSNTLYYNDTSVENGIMYYYSITANNSEGGSDPSPELSARPFAVPSSPRNTSTTITDDYILISWEPPEDDGGTRIIAYDLYRGTDIDSMEYFKRIDVIKNSYQDREIKVGETYYYYVTATNVVGESMPSDIVSATYRTAPTSPVNLTYISGNGFIHLSWLAPGNDGGSPILRYQIHRGSILVENEIVSEPNADLLEYNDTSVTNGITYTYNVTAVSDVGTSRPSNQISATPMTFPDSPLNFTVEPGNGFINISWAPPLDNGGSPIMFYSLHRSGGGVDDMEIEIPAGADLKYRDIEVQNGELYNYSISAANMVGVSDIIGPLQAMPKGISTPPVRVSVWYGSGFVHISWEPPLSDAGSPIIGYVVYRDNVHISDTEQSVLQFNDTDVENGMTYSYYVTALNGIGESSKSDSVWGYPFELPVLTDPPTPPRNLTLEKGEDSITLSWDIPEDDGGMDVTGYRIYRSLKVDGQFEAVDWVSSSELSWTDEYVVLDREYFYYVTAFNDVHESGPSNKVSGKIDGHVSGDDDDVKEVNWLLIIIPAVLILLILLVIGMFLIYRRGRREDEDEMSSQDAEYEPPAYDFDTIQKSTSVDHPDDDELNWE